MSNKVFQFFPLQRTFTQNPYVWRCFFKFQRSLCHEFCYGESIRHLDKRSEEHMGVSPLTRKKVKKEGHQLTVLFAIICSTVNFYPLLTTSVFSPMKTKSIYQRLKKACQEWETNHHQIETLILHLCTYLKNSQFISRQLI